MKCNATTALCSSKVLLVPYAASHVPTYHAWMQDPDLQAATASEPLSIDEEYAMQRSWRTDGDKLTFIVCLPLEPSSEKSSVDTAPLRTVKGGKDDRPENMIGDVNLFLSAPDGDDEDETEAAKGEPNSHEETNESLVIGEIELMIARTDLQRKGYGRAALMAFVDYILSHSEQILSEFHESEVSSRSSSSPSLAYLRVKINASNVRSISLFESIGFQQTAAGANYFNEVELRWVPDVDALRRHRHWVAWQILQYNEV